MKIKAFAAAASLMVLAGCASPPPGPTVGVVPPPNKPYDTFANDQATCRQYADQQVGGMAQSANNQALGSAVVGTLLGAGLGAAVGGGRGAAIGAASGATVGTAVGASGSANANMSIQQRYDMAYADCMSAKGNRVQGYQGPPPGNGPPPPGYEPPPPGYGPPPGN